MERGRAVRARPPGVDVSRSWVSMRAAHSARHPRYGAAVVGRRGGDRSRAVASRGAHHGPARATRTAAAVHTCPSRALSVLSLPVAQRTVAGTALRALGDQARHARLLVIGRHRQGAGIEVTLGATGRGLVESAPCPVLVAAHQRGGRPDRSWRAFGPARRRRSDRA